MPRWACEADPGRPRLLDRRRHPQQTPPKHAQYPQHAETTPAPINDISQLLDAVTLGNAVA